MCRLMEGEDLATAMKPSIWLRATKPQDFILQKQEEASLQAHTKPILNSELPAERERKGKGMPQEGLQTA